MKPAKLAYDNETNTLIVLVLVKETWKEKEYKKIGSIKLDA